MRVLTLLLVGVLVLGGCGDAESSHPSDDDSGCPAVEVVGLRGQGQSLQHHRGLGTEVDRIVRRATRLLRRDGDRSVRVRAIRHRSLLSADQASYDADVAQGRRLLARTLRTVTGACPRSRVLVIGFSQGAQIAHETLAASPALARRVDTLVLVADPRRDPTARVDRVALPGATPTGHGSVGAGPSLGALSARTVDACVPGDVVCSRPASGPIDYTVHRHAYETAANGSAIAAAAARMLTRR